MILYTELINHRAIKVPRIRYEQNNKQKKKQTDSNENDVVFDIKRYYVIKVIK